CVDGPRLARDHLACSAEVACSHVSGLLVQSGWTAGPDGVREPSPHHSNGIDVPMKSQVWLGCVGSTDCAISSARASTVGGISRPSALAVLRLISSSYLVGAWTGRSAGFSPLRMRST